MDFKAYPWLSADEFTECCHRLEARYCRATLGPLRRRWKLSAISSLDLCGASVGTGSSGGYVTYLQIVRPLEVALDSNGLAAEIEKLGVGLESWGQSSCSSSEIDAAGEGLLDSSMETDELQDEAVLRVSGTEGDGDGDVLRDVGRVIYEIHLHPTYRIPCLWFSLEGLPVDEPAFDIETVFRRLVPDQYKGGLRALGHMGGISMDKDNQIP
ncbi:Autophagy-related protein atg10 [Ceratocystis lukuohia]|uniref:Autophagy-related protein atg10 n=1 Tax=Ceratocystis lukuohia TaxID=2019550 RepID=A0ABR4MJX8_9PEZI